MNLCSLAQNYTMGRENAGSGPRLCTSGPPDAPSGSRCWEGTGNWPQEEGRQLPTGAEKATLLCHQVQPVTWQQPPGSFPLKSFPHHPAPYRICCFLIDPSGMFLSVWWYPYCAGASILEGHRATAECGPGPWGSCAGAWMWEAILG